MEHAADQRGGIDRHMLRLKATAGNGQRYKISSCLRNGFGGCGHFPHIKPPVSARLDQPLRQ